MRLRPQAFAASGQIERRQQSRGYFSCLALVCVISLAASCHTLQAQDQQSQSIAGLPTQPMHSAQEAQAAASNPNGLSWDDVKTRFEAQNPTLSADTVNVREMKAQEITAHLRPNPQFTVNADGTQIAPYQGVWRPLSGVSPSPNISYLHERDGKRELRTESARQGTAIATSQHADLERNLLFNLRSQFIATMQAKAILALAHEELDYYDHLIEISRVRWQKGDIAQVDFDRIQLQRTQYESELETAIVNLRQSKIILLQLMHDKTPIEKFDVKGNFDFMDQVDPLETYHQTALDSRPDLKAAYQTVQQAITNHKLAIANGSTDPTFGAWYTYNPSFSNPYAHQTLGLSVSIPLRIFDRNQGEKARTALDITRNQLQQDAVDAQVFADVDSAYAQVVSTLNLLRPYRASYLDQASRIRDNVTYSYQRGGASLLDLLNAQDSFRSTELTYLQLIGTYMTAGAQLNLAVGREVIP